MILSLNLVYVLVCNANKKSSNVLVKYKAIIGEKLSVLKRHVPAESELTEIKIKMKYI